MTHNLLWFTPNSCYIPLFGSLFQYATSACLVHSSTLLHPQRGFTPQVGYIIQIGSLIHHATSRSLVHSNIMPLHVNWFSPFFGGENLKRNDYNHFSFYQSYLVIQTLVLHVTSHFMVHSPSSLQGIMVHSNPLLHLIDWFTHGICYIPSGWFTLTILLHQLTWFTHIACYIFINGSLTYSVISIQMVLLFMNYASGFLSPSLPCPLSPRYLCLDHLYILYIRAC